MWEEGVASLGKSLAVVFDESVDHLKISEKRLQEVLVCRELIFTKSLHLDPFLISDICCCASGV